MHQTNFPPNMRTPDAARYLNVSSSLLEKMRVAGGGPTYSKVGRAVLYRMPALDAWLVKQERQNTSDRSAKALRRGVVAQSMEDNDGL
ncbi:MAG: helix-turn-helix domain-containing protein [Paracoccaceae bacterium]